MNTQHTEILSALIDGEPIDPVALEAALELADARRALVDFVRLRQSARSENVLLPPSLHHLRHLRDPRRVLRWAAAAAVLLLVFLAGLAVPAPWRDAAVEAADVPPKPTRVERFQPGVDWHQGN